MAEEVGWSLRAIARAAGHSPANVAKLAKAGLLPGYEGSSRQGAGIDPDLAEAFTTVLRNRCYTMELAELMKSDPHQALAIVQVLKALCESAVAKQAATTETETEVAA